MLIAMRVEKIMTRDVLTVASETPLKEVARLLVANGISGVPVCDASGHVLGVVSEVDILRKEEGVSPEMARPLAWLVRQIDGELAKISADTAGEAMTAPALTVRPTQQVQEVARLMIDYRVNRIPVVGPEGLVGIVSRADLVRAFIRSDEEIEREIRNDVLLETMMLEPGDVDVTVHDGRVVLSGRLHTHEDAEILERFVRRVPGVLDVEVEMGWESGDSFLDRHAGSNRA